MENQLDETEASGMTVNERLAVLGLLEEFNYASAKGDVAKLQEILDQLYLDPKTIQAIIGQYRPRNGG